MTKHSHFRQLWYFLLLLIALFSLATSCYAVSMQVQVGFDGVQKSRAWTPVAVQLENTSDENIDGMLIINKPEDIKDDMPLCTAPVSLPAHSNKLYHSYIRLFRYGGEITVVLANGNRVIEQRKVKINPAGEDDKLVVSIGDRSSRLGFLQGETIKVLPKFNRYNGSSSSEATINTGSISQSILPDRPAAYDGVDVLVVSDITPASTNQNALKALAMWTASGGTLVISTGADYRRYTDEFYRELLPVTVTGAANLPGFKSLLSFTNKPFPASAITVAKSTPRAGIGSVLASDGGVPIVVERKYGAGRVIFLAFDYKSSPFRDWDGQGEFWKTILKMPTSSPFVQTMGSNEYMGQNNYYYNQEERAERDLGWVIAQKPSVKSPSFNTIGIFLLAYLLVLVPVNYVFLKRKRRLELAWLTTPIIVVAFSVGAYAIGYTMKGGRLQINEAVLVEGSSNARYARSMADASLFSPARRTYDISVSDPLAVTQAIRSEERDISPIAILAEKSVISDVSLAMWSSRSFEDISGVDLGGAINSDLVLVGNKIKGKIANNTSTSFKDCKIVYGGSTLNIGNFRPGASKNIDIDYKSGTQVYLDPTDNDTQIDQRLYTFTRNRTQATSTPTLLATPESNTPVFGLSSNNPSIERAALYAFRLDYTINSGEFKLNRGMLDNEIVESNEANMINTSDLPHATFYSAGYFVASYRLPVQVSSSTTITSLKLEGKSNESGSPISFDKAEAKGISAAIYNYRSGSWNPVIVGRGKTISPASMYIGPRNEVRIKIRSAGKVSNIGAGMWVSAEGRRL